MPTETRMKRVIQASLNRNPYSLEEDAYARLEVYLAESAAALAENHDREEILLDLEQAVADQLAELLGGQKVDLVLSDMAPNLSGIAAADAARVEDIVELAIEFARQHLKPSGCLLVKCFNGTGYNQILDRFRQVFRVVSPKKPKASRDKSSEIFLLGRGLRHEPRSGLQGEAEAP